MTSTVAELGRAARRLYRRPASAIGIVLTLILGIAISVSMFTVLHGVALQALPYANDTRIVNIFSENIEQGSRRAFTAAEAVAGLTNAPGFERIAYYNTPPFKVIGRDAPRQMQIANVSEDYFPVFGISAALGRTLQDTDFAEGRAVVVLSHYAWSALTGGDSDVVGRTLRVETLDSSASYQLEVVGVLPEWFDHPRTGLLYRPWDPTAPVSSTSLRVVSAVGRLAPDASELAAEALQARMTAVQEAHGFLEVGWRVRHSPLIDEVVGDVRGILSALFAVSVLVLLIACSTASSLISIRLEQRRGEFAMRRALGASRGRVGWDVALELGMLATLSALGGVVLAYAIVAGIQPLAAGILPRTQNIEIDRAALGFAAAATLAGVSVSAALPLLRALVGQPTHGLHGAHRREVTGGRRIALLPAMGIGLAAVALVTALALAVSLVRLGNIDPGFDSENVYAIEMTHSAPAAQLNAFVDRVAEGLRAVPGVQGVAATVGSPPTAVSSGWTPMEFTVRGQGTSEPRLANVRVASPMYHRLLGIPLVSGRDVSAQDSVTALRVVVINEALARQAFGDADPIGEVLMVGFGGLDPAPVAIVGVVGDTRNAGLRAPPHPEMTFPLAQMPGPRVTLLARASPLTTGGLGTLEQAIGRATADQAATRSYLLTDDLDLQMRRERFFATATSWFAAFALLLAAIGVNAVIAAMQQRRTREIGLRLALGASPRDAAALMFVNAARITGLGLATGMLLAIPAVNGLRHVLFNVETASFLGLFGLTTLVLIAATLAAVGLPAWRASRTAPMEALRYE